MTNLIIPPEFYDPSIPLQAVPERASRVPAITEPITVNCRVIINEEELSNVLEGTTDKNYVLGRASQNYFLGTGLVLALVSDNTPGHFTLTDALWYVIPSEYISSKDHPFLAKFLDKYENRHKKSWMKKFIPSWWSI